MKIHKPFINWRQWAISIVLGQVAVAWLLCSFFGPVLPTHVCSVAEQAQFSDWASKEKQHQPPKVVMEAALKLPSCWAAEELSKSNEIVGQVLYAYLGFSIILIVAIALFLLPLVEYVVGYVVGYAVGFSVRRGWLTK